MNWIALLLVFLLSACLTKKETATTTPLSFNVEANDRGYVPDRISVPKSAKSVEIIFTRTSENTCATEVIVEDQNIEVELPLNKPVSIQFDTTNSNEVIFGCHMDKMFKGTISKL